MNIFGVDLSDNKIFGVEVLKLYGIGKSRAYNCCKKFNLFNVKVKHISGLLYNKILEYMSNYMLGYNLLCYTNHCIDRLKFIKCYRGIRHNKGLPVRGQRTRTNSKTVRRLFLSKKK